MQHSALIKKIAKIAFASMGRERIRAVIFLPIALLVLSKLLLVCVPVLLKVVLDHLGENSLQMGTVLIVCLYAFARFGSELLQEIKNWLFIPIMARCAKTLTLEVHEHLFRLPLSFQLDQRIGALTRILDRGGDAVLTLISQVTFHVAPKIVELALTLALLSWAYSYIPAFILLGTISVYVAITFWLTSGRVRLKKKMDILRSSTSAMLSENIQNFEIIHVLRNQRARRMALDGLLTESEKLTIAWERNLVAINITQALIIAVGIAASLTYAGIKVRNHVYTIGDFVLMNSLIIQITAQLGNAASMYRNVTDSLGDINASMHLLAQPVDIETKHISELTLRDCSVSINDVSFSYKSGKKALNHVSLSVQGNTKVAIVGPTGAGKTSVIRMLSGLIVPESGTIEIGGHPIGDISENILGNLISVVPQDITLFNGTIADNIRNGKPDATDLEVMSAAMDAQLGPFLSELPAGIDAEVGERGLKLSGGERQRIALARSIIRKSKIIILDEATSALDMRTEAAIKEALDKIHGVTLIVIAHRLSSIVDFDQIIVLDNGSIAERGTHQELLRNDSIYAGMWRRQINSHQEDSYDLIDKFA